MNLVPMYQEWKNRFRIEITSPPSTTEIYRASVVAVKFNTQNGPRYMLQKARQFRYIHEGSLVTEELLSRIIDDNRNIRPDATIYVYELESLTGVRRINVLGDIMRLISDPSTIRGEPQNVRV